MAPIMMMSAGSSSGGYTSHVANNLSSKLILIVHCHSGDDDLKAHTVAYGSEYSWNFGMNIWGSTLFWCNLAVQDKRLSFVAVKVDRDGFPARWVVRDDGVYGIHEDGREERYARWNS
ncbi:S-protein homolog 21 [Linum perenne]